jgi:hypothetical protein
MTKEDLLELLDCNYVYVALHNCDFGAVSDCFIARSQSWVIQIV